MVLRLIAPKKRPHERRGHCRWRAWRPLRREPARPAWLRRVGIRRAPVERHAVHCTGVLAADAFDEFGLPRDAVLNPLTTVRFHSPSGQSVAYTSERIEAVAVDRLCFDQQLHAAAAQSGAAIELGRRVDDVRVDCQGVTLEFRDGGPSRFRTVVLPAAPTISCSAGLVSGCLRCTCNPLKRKCPRRRQATSRCISADASHPAGLRGSFRSGGPEAGTRASV